MDVRKWFYWRGLCVAAGVLLMVLIGWWRGPVHDYHHYRTIWADAAGGNAWTSLNTYGPAFLLFAPLANTWWFLPKMVFIIAFGIGVGTVAGPLLPRRLGWRPVLIGGLLAVYPVVAVAAYGLNDAVVAGLVAGAVVARRNGAVSRAGVLLGLAALVKFYPLAFAVFFAVPFAKNDRKVLYWASCVAGAGMIAGWAVTGNGVWDPIFGGGNRNPTLMSIFAAFRAHPDIPGASLARSMDGGMNTLMVSVSVLAIAFAGRRFRLTWLETAVIGVALMFAVYKVGHPQFWLPWMILVTAVASESDRGRRLSISCVGWLAFLSLFQIGYSWTDGYMSQGRWVRDSVGFVAPWVATAGPACWVMLERRRGTRAAHAPERSRPSVV